MKKITKVSLLVAAVLALLPAARVAAQSCTGSATINVTISQQPTATITNGASVTIPAGGSATLTANAISGATYEWFRGGVSVSSGINQNTLNVTQAGSYTVEITNSAGCADLSSATLVSVQSGINVPFKLFVEGAFNGTNLNTSLGAVAGTIPTAQPYSAAPWNYAGTESVSSVPANVVDWVLVQAVNNSTFAVVESRAAFLLADGTIQDPTGSTGSVFSSLTNGTTYHFILRHRNHLDVMTRQPLTASASMIQYDFTTAATQAFGNDQMKQVATGVYALYAGDYNADGIITVKDFNRYVSEASQFGYRSADGNLNRTVETQDFNLYQPNSSIIGIPQIRLVVP